jgi:hypothetical protein
MIFFAVGTPIPFTLVSSERVEELTLTTTVVDLPDFFGVLDAGEGLGLGLGLRLGEGLGLGEALGVSVEAGGVPPPTPGTVKSWALGVPAPGTEGVIPPGAEGAPGMEGSLTGGLVSWAETAKGRATPTAQQSVRINFWGTIAHFSSLNESTSLQ